MLSTVIATKPVHRLQIRPTVPKLHPGPCSGVGIRRGTDRHTDTQMAVVTIHFALAILTRNVTTSDWNSGDGALLGTADK